MDRVREWIHLPYSLTNFQPIGFMIFDQILPIGFPAYNIQTPHQSPQSLDWR
jgi:hypothetical protein